MNIDHIVISVSNLKASIEFYSKVLGKPIIGNEDAHWDIGSTKFFIAYPYKKSARKFDKANLGLNHIAFRASSRPELNKYLNKLQKANIANSGVQIDKYSNKEFVWFDDPDGIRLEFYLR